MVVRIVSLVLALVVLGLGVAVRRDPAWFVDRSPATKHDPTVDRDVFLRQTHRMGLVLVILGAVLVLGGVLGLVATA